MSLIGQAWRRLVFLLRRRQLDEDLAEELRQHAALKAQKNAAAGMDPEEAAYAAHRQLGNVTRQMEESRQSWGFPFLESVAQDIGYGLRGLRKAPGFTTVAMLTLALGIGSCTAVFSVVYAVLLRPLPYQDSPRMVHVWTVSPRFPEFKMGQSIPNMNDIKALAHSFDATAAYETRRMNLTGNGEPEQLSVPAVSPGFFAFFGVHPVRGREFFPEDEQEKDGDVVLLSYGFWQRHFAGDPNVVGSRIMLEQKPYTVAGVLPRGFSFPEKSDAWVPFVIDPKHKTERGRWMYFMLAKLRGGVSLPVAQAEMDGIAAGTARQYPKEAEGIQFSLVTLQEATVADGRDALVALLGAVGFLLLIACANVSNLVLSRGLKRQREIALRAALGASRVRIVRQLLTESLLVACAGGFAGIALAVVGIQAFRALAPASFPRLAELRVEPTTALIACIITAFAGILCGLVPALSASRANLNLAIKEKTADAHLGRLSLRGFLVIVEVALALVLLTGSALMVQSIVRLLRVDTGWRTDHLLTASLNLSKTRYGSADAQRLFIQRLLDALRAQPQFTGVAFTNNSLMAGSTSLTDFDPATLGINDKKTTLEARSVSPGYFETLGVRLGRGRFFNDHDVKGAPQAVIINESFARRFFSGQDPLGKILKFSPNPADQCQIVGQVSDTRDISLNAQPRLQVYFPLLQDPFSGMTIVVRSALEPSTAVAQLQRSVWSVDNDQPLTKVQSMSDVITTSVAGPRFRAWLLSVFAFTGLTLTLIGIYGVISYSVGQRTQEMGIRMALGAPRSNILRLILREGVVLALAGAVCGLTGSYFLMRLLASQLFEIKPSDPLTLSGAALLMVTVALAGAYIPARRATKVDPMIALRYE
ncbi:MAG TPA: ABC transporter permease [Verrucomicrobiae bacterium]|nr:ABC transporter permease [Verrucomicrobiae bacterium]